jgi:PD-(D/E)XK endonuclease
MPRASARPADERARSVRPPKARGELAEARFLARAMDLGFVVSKPFGDSARYDFVVDCGGRLSRVQVKSAWTPAHHGGYQFGASPAQLKNQPARPYRRDEIDFIVACIVPEDAWFIVPIRALATRNHFFLPAGSRPHPLSRYREAWRLLQRAKGRL